MMEEMKSYLVESAFTELSGDIEVSRNLQITMGRPIDIARGARGTIYSGCREAVSPQSARDFFLDDLRSLNPSLLFRYRPDINVTEVN